MGLSKLKASFKMKKLYVDYYKYESKRLQINDEN